VLGRTGALADGRVRDKYASLAGATGGSFLAVEKFDTQHGRSRHEANAFLDAIERGGSTGDDAARHERQRQYELEARSGSAEKFDWYKALPPPRK